MSFWTRNLFGNSTAVDISLSYSMIIVTITASRARIARRCSQNGVHSTLAPLRAPTTRCLTIAACERVVVGIQLDPIRCGGRIVLGSIYGVNPRCAEGAPSR